MPKYCPVCGAPVVRREDEAVAYCESRTCPAKLKAWLRHFTSRDVYDIDGFGEKLADILVDNAMVKHPLDIFDLTVSQLEALERMGKKSATKLVAAIQKSREVPLDQFLMGLNIPTLGHTVSRLLMENFTFINDIIDATPRQLESIEGIGSGIAAQVKAGLSMIAKTPIESDNILRWLTKITIRHTEKPASVSDGPLGGELFVVTGKLSVSREQIHEMILHAGGKVSGSISKKTNYLVCGEAAGSKKEKAIKLGVTCISEADLRMWCKQPAAAAV